MRVSGSIIHIHRTPAGTKKGGHAPFIKNESVPSPSNCNNPCCYGSGRSFCWPCMKRIREDHNTNKKV